MIFCFGGSGFIGQALESRLKNCEVPYRILDIQDRGSKQFVEVDITKKDMFSALETPDLIINLAAEHRDDVRPTSKYYETNVDGSKYICEFARARNVSKLIFVSSVAIYGNGQEDLTVDGQHAPTHDYGKSKLAGESVYRDWFDEDPENRSLVIVRPTVVFGRGNRGNVWELINSIYKKRFLMVGNGKNKKSMAYIENVADFLLHCSSLGSGFRVFNYTDKPDLDMNSLVSVIQGELGYRNSIIRMPYWVARVIGFIFDVLSKVFNKHFAISGLRVKKFASETVFSSNAHEAGFLPKHSLLDGLKKTIECDFLNK